MSDSGATTGQRGSLPLNMNPPQLSLPDGGASIRGMSETLTPVTLHGTGGYSIPVRTIPSRGPQPDLVLTYFSARGNSQFGLSWDVDLPAVSRKTEMGLPHYDGSDRYVLTGEDDLILVSTAAGPAPIGGSGEVVTTHRYQPRTEARFARIERHVRAEGDVFWTHLSAVNVLTVFGRSPEARIADPDNPSHIFSWLVEDVFDDRGSRMHYRWAEDDGVGIPAPASEVHRLFGGAQRSLREIVYLNSDPVSDRWTAPPITHEAGWRDDFHLAVVFDYGGHHETAPHPEPDHAWPPRADRFSTRRPGFEVRTQRLCRRILSFTSVPTTAGPAPWRLVGATELEHQSRPTSSLLTTVRYRGFDDSGGSLALPPVHFDYTTTSQATGTTALTASSPSHARALQWADLDSDGAPGLLGAGENAWQYSANLGEGIFSAPRDIHQWPVAADSAGPHFGDSRLVATLGVKPQLYAVRDPETLEWLPWRSYDSLPVLGGGGAELREIDLDGDGRSDLLVNRGTEGWWYPFLGEEGWGAGRRADTPPISFGDPTAATLVADLTGDGLCDIVRIRSGSIVYWPNLGHGRFGNGVTMDDAPELDGTDFDPRRVLLANLDGGGPADLLYFGAPAVRCWRNQCGNGWGAPQTLSAQGVPLATDSVDLVDLFGRGTPCLVFSSDRPDVLGLRYVDLMPGGKPDLLCRISNGRGLETTISWSTSTSFALADRRFGRPWSTHLPVPVHVVSSATVTDLTNGATNTASYRYRDGYFDPIDREFRGFGRVDRIDAESFAPGAGPATVPPRLTVSWFHTGAERQLQPPRSIAERLDAKALEHHHEARRSLRGMLVRRASYTLDGSARARFPHDIGESSCRLRVIYAPASDPDRFCVTMATPMETVDRLVEREPGDPEDELPDQDALALLPAALDLPPGPAPRIQHRIVHTIDAYGMPERTVDISYGRRDSGAFADQRPASVVISELQRGSLDEEPDGLRLGVPLEERAFEVLNPIVPTIGLADSTTIALLLAAPLVSPDSTHTGPLARRLIGLSRTRYWNNDVSSELPQGYFGSRALPRRTLTAALTPAQAESFEPELDADSLRDEGGYVEEADPDSVGIQVRLWAPSSVVRPDPGQYCVPVAIVDPFGIGTFVTYDPLGFLPLEVLTTRSTPDLKPDATAPAWNRTRAQYDPRTLAPNRVMDAHGSVDEAVFDALGAVAFTRRRGARGEGAPAGEWDTASKYSLAPFLPGAPLHAEIAARVENTTGSAWQRTVTYLDGRGRPLLVKVQAEAGQAPVYGADGVAVLAPDGSLVLAATPTRWLGTGRVILDGAGRPVAQYDPYFAPDERFDYDANVVAQGTPSVIGYDAAGRPARTDHADGSLELTKWGPWSTETWDRSDTVLESGWYARRNAPTASTEDQSAAAKSAKHARTPSIAHIDAAGNVVRSALVLAITAGKRVLTTTTLPDAAGRPLRIWDPRGIVVFESRYDLLGRPLYTASADSGTSRDALDVLGRPLRTWTGITLWPGGVAWPGVSAGGGGGGGVAVEFAVRERIERDNFGRERATWESLGAGQPEHCRLLVKYGDEDLIRALDCYLLGVADCVLDGAGVSAIERCDHRGNPMQTAHWALLDPELEPAWDPNLGDLPQADAESEPARSIAIFDALDRVTSTIAADGSIINYTYSPRGLPATITVTTPNSDVETVLADAEYDERGRRRMLRYGPGGGTAMSVWQYDPLSRRLARLTTTTSASGGPVHDLQFGYDVAGSVLVVHDGAQRERFFANSVVPADRLYSYDSLGRLITAEGRETAGTAHTTAGSLRTPSLDDLPSAKSGNAIVRYREEYTYDDSGTLTSLRHVQKVVGGAVWTRTNTPAASSNRLVRSTPSAETLEISDVDSRGNTLILGERTFIWNGAGDVVRSVVSGNVTAHYRSDAAGERIRTRVVSPGRREERRTEGNLETLLVHQGPVLVAHESTLRIALDDSLLALVERAFGADGMVTRRVVRFQLGDHLGSVAVELDAAGGLLSSEEFHPYGTTAYESRPATVGVSRKRYRFAGRVRDEETGLQLHGARYYVPWLGRWLSPDPLGLVDGTNVYAYARGAPTTLVDSSGASGKTPAEMTLDEYHAVNARRPPDTRLTDEAVRRRYAIDHPKSTKNTSEPSIAPPPADPPPPGTGPPGTPATGHSEGTADRDQEGNPNEKIGGSNTSPGFSAGVSGGERKSHEGGVRGGDYGEAKNDLDYAALLAKALDLDPSAFDEKGDARSGGLPNGRYGTPNQVGQVAYVAIQTILSLFSSVRILETTLKDIAQGIGVAFLQSAVLAATFAAYEASQVDSRIASNDPGYAPDFAGPSGSHPLPAGTAPYQLPLFPTDPYQRRSAYGSQHFNNAPGMTTDHVVPLSQHWLFGEGPGTLAGFRMTPEERRAYAKNPGGGLAPQPRSVQNIQGGTLMQRMRRYNLRWGLIRRR